MLNYALWNNDLKMFSCKRFIAQIDGKYFLLIIYIYSQPILDARVFCSKRGYRSRMQIRTEPMM